METERIQIGAGSKYIDFVALLSFCSVILTITVVYYHSIFYLMPFYLAISIYAYTLRKRHYVFFENGLFKIENLYGSQNIGSSLYQGLSSAGLETFFANTVVINFKDGRSFKFTNTSKEIERLDNQIRLLIGNVR